MKAGATQKKGCTNNWTVNLIKYKQMFKKGERNMFEYEITEHIAEISRSNDRVLEVNMVSWNKRPPKLDIRRWSEDHTFMGKGVALTEDEAIALYEALKGRYK